MNNPTTNAPTAQSSKTSIQKIDSTPQIDPQKLSRALSQLLTILRCVDVTVTVTRKDAEVSE